LSRDDNSKLTEDLELELDPEEPETDEEDGEEDIAILVDGYYVLGKKKSRNFW
jgi:hypothetical protein